MNGNEIMLTELDMTAVLYARDRAEAEGYRALLEDACIPATIERAPDTHRACAVVLLPQDKHERASEFIALVEASKDTEPDDGNQDEDDEFVEDDSDDDDDDDEGLDVTDDEFDDEDIADEDI